MLIVPRLADRSPVPLHQTDQAPGRFIPSRFRPWRRME
jgi:hypothetical protein